MAEAKLNIDIPKNLVEDTIRAQVLAAFMDKGHAEKLVSAVVAMALGAKKNSYDSATIFQTEVNDAIREQAMVVFREWLNVHKDLIRQKLLERIEAQSGKITMRIVDAILTEMAWIRPTVKLEFVKEDERDDDANGE